MCVEGGGGVFIYTLNPTPLKMKVVNHALFIVIQTVRLMVITAQGKHLLTTIPIWACRGWRSNWCPLVEYLTIPTRASRHCAWRVSWENGVHLPYIFIFLFNLRCLTLCFNRLFRLWLYIIVRILARREDSDCKRTSLGSTLLSVRHVLVDCKCLRSFIFNFKKWYDT